MKVWSLLCLCVFLCSDMLAGMELTVGDSSYIFYLLGLRVWLRIRGMAAAVLSVAVQVKNIDKRKTV